MRAKGEQKGPEGSVFCEVPRHVLFVFSRVDRNVLFFDTLR